MAIVAALAMAAPASGQGAPAAAGAQPAEVATAPVSELVPAPEPVPAEAPEAAVAVEEPAEATPPPVPPDPAPVSDVVAKTVDSTSAAVTKTQVAEQLPEPAAQVAKRATELSDEAQARAIEVVLAAEKAVLPALPLPYEAPAGPAAPAPDQPLPLHQAPVGEGPLTGAWLGHLADSPGGLPASHGAAGAAAADLPRVGAPPSGLIELRGAPAFSGTDFFTGTVQRFNGPVSPDSPGFPSGSTTGLGASGSGATIFIPIAALLALLALASPAILRRLREPPDFPAPTPFVCALERPG